MIVHVVLFRPRPDLDASERDAFAGSFEKALNEIPTVRSARIGRRQNLQRFYDAHNTHDFPYCAILEFDSTEDLRAYLDHPAHDELGRRFYTTSEATLVYDFDMTAAAQIRSVIS